MVKFAFATVDWCPITKEPAALTRLLKRTGLMNNYTHQKLHGLPTILVASETLNSITRRPL